MLKFIGAVYVCGFGSAVGLVAVGGIIKFWYDFVCANMGWRL